MEWIDFLKTVLPHAIDLVSTLYKSFSGDSDAAIRNISDRRNEIESMWSRLEAALKAKHETK